MGDEFHHQAEVCGGNRYSYWNIIPPSRSRSSMFGTGCASSSISGDFIGWAQQQQSDDFLGDMKLSSSTTTTTDESACNSASDGSVVIQDMHKKQPPLPHSNLITDSAATLQLHSMGIISNDLLSSSSPPPPPSSSTTTVDDDQWIINPSLMQKGNGRSETTTSNNYPSMMMIMPEEEEEDEDHESMNYRQQEPGLMDDVPPSIPSCPNSDNVWSTNLNNFSTTIPNNNNNNTSTSTKCGHGGSLSGSGYGSTSGFPISTSVSYGYSSPNLLQTLFDDDDDDPADNPQSLLYGNNNNNNNNYHLGNLNEFLSPPEFRPTTNSSFSSSGVPIPNQNNTSNALQFLNRNLITNFCTNTNNNINATAPSFSSYKSQSTTSTIISDQKPSFLTKAAILGKVNNENVKGRVSCSSLMMAKKSSIEAASESFKRPRIETPSPLPTFKVRKEKLGDRITALQQLVSPFGKTDTASVLHEAIEYIKFLHDQVGVLSTPYLRNSGSIVHQRQSCKEEEEGGRSLRQEDLRSRGLCLVPISSTFPVAAQNTTDFWTPTFGATFR